MVLKNFYSIFYTYPDLSNLLPFSGLIVVDHWEDYLKKIVEIRRLRELRKKRKEEELKLLNREVAVWFNLFLNILMRGGKRTKFTKILNKVLKKLRFFCFKEKIKLLNFFEKILENAVVPVYFLKRMVAGRILLIPRVLEEHKEKNVIIRLLLKVIKQRSEYKLYDRIFFELVDIYNNVGLTIKRKASILQEALDYEPNLRFLR